MTAIVQAPHPTTKKQVREFWEMLDIAVFEYAKIANTLHAAMARCNTSLEWMEEYE